MPTLTYRDALNQALREEMQRDPGVFLLGEEVGVYQGAYKVSRGLLEEFGPMRVVDTPIAELGFAGVGVGAAMAGLRPVVEFMTWNFAVLALDQIVNSAAKILYESGGQVPIPIVFRGPNGAALQLAAQHSQAWESWLAHIPGLKVVAPATPADAKGLLKAAIRDRDPVIFLEPKKLYRAERQEVAQGEAALLPLASAAVVRQGTDLTVVTYGYMRAVTMQAAAKLSPDGIEVEVIDLRTLRPWDVEACVRSIQKTGRLAIVYEANRTGGFGAEVAAELAERCFASLDAPVSRIASPDVPAMPFSPALEHAFMLNPDKVADGLRRVARY